MTFPTQADLGTYSSTSLNDHPANYPATVNADQLLLYFGGCDGTGDFPNITGVTGITELYSATNNSHGSAIYWLKAIGDEDGTTFNVHVSSSEELNFYCLAIDGWDGVTAPEFTGPNTATSTVPNPPSITPSWGAEDTMYIALTTWNTDAGTVTFPTNYDDNQNDSQVGTVCGTAYASREINGSPEDPGTFTVTSVAWAAFTIAVRPASGVTPLQMKNYQGMNRMSGGFRQ